MVNLITFLLLYRKCCDTNYECCLFSVIYLRLTWCRNTLIFISGVVCKPKLTCSVFGTFIFFYL
uniref:Uncharacterized protein n=1 Tax=Meleagris gallopavo TaxID=9103 RepID=A0A803YK15_MELGA